MRDSGAWVELTERQERVLRAIVEHYTATAHPVSSGALVGAPGLNVSSATVRHEMGVLEEYGYIRHLHTSGGRIPTSLGYRYYVERLMLPSRVPTSEARTIMHQFHQAHTELQEWLRLAATVMAHRMHNVGLVTAPKQAEVRLRHLEAISIQRSIVLIIVVLQEGTVIQEMMPLDEPHTQEELSTAADHLSQILRGMTAAQVEARIADFPALHSTIASVACSLLRRGGEQQGQIFHAGLADMIRQPEFQGPLPGQPGASPNERLSQMVELLQQGLAIQQLCAGMPALTDVQIVIGGGTAGEALQDYSFVLGRYGGEDDSSGFLGVLGPTRMEYPRAVALVRYMTELMTNLMHGY